MSPSPCWGIKALSGELLSHAAVLGDYHRSPRRSVRGEGTPSPLGSPLSVLDSQLLCCTAPQLSLWTCSPSFPGESTSLLRRCSVFPCTWTPLRQHLSLLLLLTQTSLPYPLYLFSIHPCPPRHSSCEIKVPVAPPGYSGLQEKVAFGKKRSKF